jgi:hypothetical protein
MQEEGQKNEGGRGQVGRGFKGVWEKQKKTN